MQDGRAAPTVAVDVALFTVLDGALHVLLVPVRHGPFAGQWALPGGRVGIDEPLDDAAARYLARETGMRDAYLEQLYTFGSPRRDPQGRVVSVAYVGLVADGGGTRATEGPGSFHRVTRLPRLAYDHRAVVRTALGRLRGKLTYTNLVYTLLPRAFTLAELQTMYEAILGRQLDRRNFRKKVLSLGLLRPLGRLRRGPHRPAALHAFRQRRPMVVEILPVSRLPALCALLGLCAPALAAPAPEPTFSIDYLVRSSSRDPTRAHVHWQLSGIDEIERLRLVFRDDRATDVQGSGRLEWQGRTCHWTPGRPYAHLRYTVRIDHQRPPAGHFDSHAGPDWIATRALHLFPEINVTFRSGTAAARSRARLLFRLPHGWRSVTALAPLEDGAYRVEEPGKRFDRPRGWFLLGHVARHRRTIAGSEVTVALAPGSTLDPRALFRLYDRTMPLLTGLLGPPPPRLLIVSAPDPMWRGGLSGEDSFFVNARIPLRSPDRTSTYVHELFHVWQPFRPAPDGHWIAEGLAEYYSLALPFRAGRLSARGFTRGIELFARYGRWDLDLSRTRAPEALNNSAPLVMYWIDHAMRRATEDRHSLDDAVRLLARAHTPVTTASFLSAVNRVTGRDFTPLFRRHVYRGVRPPLAEQPAAFGH